VTTLEMTPDTLVMRATGRSFPATVTRFVVTELLRKLVVSEAGAFGTDTV